MMILLITRRASKAPDMRSRSQRVAKSFYLSLSLSLSLSAGRTFSLRGKRFGKSASCYVHLHFSPSYFSLMSSRFTVDGQRAEDREEEMATDISRGTLAKKAEARRDGL